MAYDMRAFADAIAGIESAGSGDYGAVGPRHPSLGRALGRYQIMEANIPSWSREAIGREVTAAEFMANPDLQDAIFAHRFGGYVDRFGPEGAAQAWFAGPGGVGKTGRKDILGTTVGEYGDRFSAALGGPQGGAGDFGAYRPESGGNALAAPRGASDGGMNALALEAQRREAMNMLRPRFNRLDPAAFMIGGV